MITLHDEIIVQYKWSDYGRSDVRGDILKAISELEDNRYLYSCCIAVSMKAYRSMVVHPDIYEIVKYVAPHTLAGAIDYLFQARIARIVASASEEYKNAVVVIAENEAGERGRIVIRGVA